MKATNISNNSFLKPIKNYSVFNSINFYCDFETILIDNIHYVSCFSIVGPRINYCKSLSNINNFNIKSKSNELLLDFIYTCTDLKQNLSFLANTKIFFFFHNFNKFDSFFIINSLSNKKEFNINLITRNRTIYKMVVSNSLNNSVLEFRDTYLLLNISLERIGHIFAKEYKKIKFDHSLNNLEIYKNNNFFFKKKKVEIYCLNDSLVLREGFECFIKEIKRILFINPLLCLSLPSLAIKIFLKNFYDLKNGAIENCEGNKEIFIRKSYKGASVDVFKPHMIKGYHYDINSLYPYVMKEFHYPVGKGVFVKSSEINLDTFFGFIEVKVFCPFFIKIPLLTKYDKFKGLICPTGKWKDIYFSEELKVAKSLGYKFKILRGVSYKKKKIFENIINQFYKLRNQYSKNSPSNTILKLLMNSLYGRFGMKPTLPVTQIVDKKEYNEIQAVYEILDQTVLNKKIIVVFIKKPVLEKLNLLKHFNLIAEDKYNNLKKESLNKPSFTPVQIASAITSYARIIMYKYKSDNNNKIYYSDTDSIFCKYPIHNRYLSNTKLGFMKKCGKVEEAYFIAPKIYACLYANKFDIKCKGVNKGLVSFEDIKSMYAGKGKSFYNTLLFKKDYKKFIIKKIMQRVDISAKFLKRKKIYTNNTWTSTSPINIDNYKYE
jgi:hypothetical protein